MPRVSGMNKNRRASPTKAAPENNAGGVLPNQLVHFAVLANFTFLCLCYISLQSDRIASGTISWDKCVYKTFFHCQL